jgi:hypothetical protein
VIFFNFFVFSWIDHDPGQDQRDILRCSAQRHRGHWQVLKTDVSDQAPGQTILMRRYCVQRKKPASRRL